MSLAILQIKLTFLKVMNKKKICQSKENQKSKTKQ